MRIVFNRLAAAQFASLTPAQQEQARRLVRAIVLADTHVGRPWNTTPAGRRQWIASAYDTHLVYRIAFRQVEQILYRVHSE